MMTKETLAQSLDGREYGHHIITKEEEQVARNAGLVVIYGASDDLMELRGAIRDEFGSGENDDFYFNKEGKALPEDLEEHAEWLQEHGMLEVFKNQYKNKITSHWCGEGRTGDVNPDISWQYSTSIPHSTFRIMEDGEVYCLGIVLNLQDLV